MYKNCLELLSYLYVLSMSIHNIKISLGHRLSLYLCINFLQYFTDTPGAMDKALSHYKIEQEQKCTHLDGLYNSKQTFYRFMLIINTF